MFYIFVLIRALQLTEINLNNSNNNKWITKLLKLKNKNITNYKNDKCTKRFTKTKNKAR